MNTQQFKIKTIFEPVLKISFTSEMLKRWSINISKYFFLFLFLGFFGSTTFFNHAHVVDGITIVHSHPFKSDKSGNPIHSHTSNGYQLIHLLVKYTATAFFTLISINAHLFLLDKFSIKFYDQFLSQPYYISNLLRGPPAFKLS